MTRAAPGQPRAWDHVQPDATGADDDDVAARLDLRGVYHRADAGRYSVDDYANHVEGRVLANLDNIVLVDDGALGGADGLDHAGALMTQDNGRFDPRLALEVVLVGVADTACNELNFELIGGRI